MGFANGGPQARVSSPLVGCSILMISALKFFVLLFIKEKRGGVQYNGDLGKGDQIRSDQIRSREVMKIFYCLPTQDHQVSGCNTAANQFSTRLLTESTTTGFDSLPQGLLSYQGPVCRPMARLMCREPWLRVLDIDRSFLSH